MLYNATRLISATKTKQEAMNQHTTILSIKKHATILNKILPSTWIVGNISSFSFILIKITQEHDK
jgi:hypothetical protein